MKGKNITGIIFMCAFFLVHSCTPDKQENKKEEKPAVSTQDSEVERLSKAIEANPKDASAYYQRAKIYEGQKKFKLALNDINEAVANDSTKSEYFLTQANVLFANLLVPQSLEAFQKCIELDPKNIEAYLKLAELNLYIKKYKDAVQNANDVLRIDKHRAKAYFIKGFVFKEMGDTSNAISSFQTCTEQEPDNYDGYMQLGLLYGAKRNKLAIQYYNNALRLDPKSTEALYDRGLFYQDNGDLQKAIDDYQAIIQIDPSYKEAYYNIGYINLVYLDKYQEAVTYFTNAINSAKYYVDAYYNRGLSYEKLGNKAAAEADYKEALSIMPTYKLAIAAMKRLEK
jgi:tetratricopeptide (TPR) repeat protein